MAKKDGISGMLISVDTTKKELTLEENMISFEAEPAVEDKSYSYDLDDDWDEERITRAVGEHVFGTLVDGVVKQLRLR
jgi:hypothetical protein